MTPDGTCSLKLEKDFEVECKTATIKATDSMTFDTPKAHFTGEVTSDGDMKAGDISLQKHKTSGVKGGNETSDKPVPG
jgi:phage gp45-like